jgi:hypothetical protein
MIIRISSVVVRLSFYSDLESKHIANGALNRLRIFDLWTNGIDARFYAYQSGDAG